MKLLIVINSDCLWGRELGARERMETYFFTVYSPFVFCFYLFIFTMSMYYLVKKINSKLKQ